MRTLLLFVPSALAVAGLIWHAWRFRGPKIALSFFPAALLFGIIRGNIVHWVTVEAQGGVMPYVFTHPVIQIFSASLQAVIGWVFAIYISWWLAERVLERVPSLKDDLMATVGMACVGMAAISYCVEAGAAAAGWWIWSIPTHNPYFVGVPAVGIMEWSAVGFEFLIPYLLAFCSPGRKRIWPHLLWCIFVGHLFLHLLSEPVSPLLPTQPFVLWHWVSLLVMAGLALTGVGSIRIQTRAVVEAKKSGEWVMWGAVGLFVAVMGIAQVGLGNRPELLVSLVPLALLALMAIPRVPYAGVLVAGAGAWGLEGLGLSFLPLPVVALLLLQLRDGWGGGWVFRVGVGVSLIGMGWGVYKDGLHRSQQCGSCLYYMKQSDFYARKGKMDQADKLWSKALSHDPEDVESYLQMGYSLEANGYPHLAVVLYRKAIGLEPGLFLGHFDLGIALDTVKDKKGAEAALRRSVEIAPRFYDGHLKLGTFYLSHGVVDSALICFDRAIQLERDKPEAYNNLGVAQQRLGQRDLALASWEKTLSLDPTFADAYRNIGDVRLKAGEVDAAVNAYEAAIGIDPNDAQAQQGLTMAQWAKSGKKPEAP